MFANALPSVSMLELHKANNVKLPTMPLCASSPANVFMQESFCLLKPSPIQSQQSMFKLFNVGAIGVTLPNAWQGQPKQP